MFTLAITEKGGKTSIRDFDQGEITIGRVQGNDILLPKSNISKQHARIVRQNDKFVVIDTRSTNGTYVNGKRIDAPHDLADGDKLYIGDFTIELRVRETAASSAGDDEVSAPSDVPSVSGAKLAMEESDSGWGGKWEGEESSSGVEVPIGDVASAPRVAPRVGRAPTDDSTEESTADSPGKLRAGGGAPRVDLAPAAVAPPPILEPGLSPLAAALRAVHLALIDAARATPTIVLDEAQWGHAINTAVAEIFQGPLAAPLAADGASEEGLQRAAKAEAVGLAPIAALLADDAVAQVIIDSPSRVFALRGETLEPTNVSFSCNEAVESLVHRVAARAGHPVGADRSSVQLTSARDALDLVAVLPPVAAKGSAAVIRKTQGRPPLLVDDLVAGGTLTADMAVFLEQCVQGGRNLLVCGAPGSGKSVLLGVLASFVPGGARIVSIDRRGDLQLEQPHVVVLRPSSAAAGSDAASPMAPADVVRAALLLRPDRIVLDDCEGAEAFDLVRAMTAGANVLMSMHADHPLDALARLEALARTSASGCAAHDIQALITAGVDAVVHIGQDGSGARRVLRISEVATSPAGHPAVHELFVFEPAGSGGSFRASGVVPDFYESLGERGVETDLTIFEA